MTIIGLTGRAGSGKSEAEKVILAHFSCHLLDLDKMGHEVLNEPFVLQRLIETFGSEILVNNTINRKSLGAIVFSEKEKLNQLNLIVHPFIKMKVVTFLENHPKEDVIISGALLKEIGLSSYCKFIVVIDSEEEEVKRMSPRQFEIGKLQRSRESYRKEANYIVFNSYNEDYYDALRTVLKKCFGT